MGLVYIFSAIIASTFSNSDKYLILPGLDVQLSFEHSEGFICKFSFLLLYSGLLQVNHFLRKHDYEIEKLQLEGIGMYKPLVGLEKKD